MDKTFSGFASFQPKFSPSLFIIFMIGSTNNKQQFLAAKFRQYQSIIKKVIANEKHFNEAQKGRSAASQIFSRANYRSCTASFLSDVFH